MGNGRKNESSDYRGEILTNILACMAAFLDILVTLSSTKGEASFHWGIMFFLLCVLMLLLILLRKKIKVARDLESKVEEKENTIKRLNKDLYEKEQKMIQTNSEVVGKNDFLDFLCFLFNHQHGNNGGFSLLPRMCLQIERDRDVNPIHIKQLRMSISADMRKWDVKEDLAEDTVIDYVDTMSFEMDVVNSNLPEKYICYMGNVYSDKPTEFVQKHGHPNAEEKLVNIDSVINKTGVKPQIGKYDWEINKELIAHSDIIPINFRVKYKEKERARSTSIIIIYPKRYGEKVDEIKVDLSYLSNRISIENVTAYHIGKKNDGYFRLSSVGVARVDNGAKVEITNAKCSWTDAYYIQVKWNLVDKTEVCSE